MGLFADLWGTVKSTFQIELGGVRLKNNAANLEIMAADGTTPAAITASKVNVTGDVVDINSDAAAAAADWKYTLQRPAAGMTAAVVLTLPPTDGSAGQVIQTDGNGVLTFETAAVTSYNLKCDTTTVNWNDASPIAMLTLPANSIVHKVQVIIDTPFDAGTPALSIGIAATPSKFMGTPDVNLKGTAKDSYVVHPGEAAGADIMIATLAPSTAAAGVVRVLVFHSVPS